MLTRSGNTQRDDKRKKIPKETIPSNYRPMTCLSMLGKNKQVKKTTTKKAVANFQKNRTVQDI